MISIVKKERSDQCDRSLLADLEYLVGPLTAGAAASAKLSWTTLNRPRCLGGAKLVQYKRCAYHLPRISRYVTQKGKCALSIENGCRID